VGWHPKPEHYARSESSWVNDHWGDWGLGGEAKWDKILERVNTDGDAVYEWVELFKFLDYLCDFSIRMDNWDYSIEERWFYVVLLHQVFYVWFVGIFMLQKACQQLNLPNEYVYYFSLFLIKREEDGDITSKFTVISDKLFHLAIYCSTVIALNLIWMLVKQKHV
jgi:hypothetical protein